MGPALGTALTLLGLPSALKAGMIEIPEAFGRDPTGRLAQGVHSRYLSGFLGDDTFGPGQRLLSERDRGKRLLAQEWDKAQHPGMGMTGMDAEMRMHQLLGPGEAQRLAGMGNASFSQMDQMMQRLGIPIHDESGVV